MLKLTGHVSSRDGLLTRVGITLAAGILCQVIAALGLAKFARSEWLTFAGPFPHGWEGYTFGDFLAIFAFTCLAPVGFCVTLIAIQQAKRIITSPNSAIMLFLGSVLWLIVLGRFGFYWGWDILQCGVVFCINTDSHTWEGTKNVKPEAAIGFKTTIGIPLLITSVCFSISFLVSFIQLYSNRLYNESHDNATKLGVRQNRYIRDVNTESKKDNSYDEPLLDQDDDREDQDDRDTDYDSPFKRYTPWNTHLLSQSKPYITMPDSSDKTKLKSQNSKYWIWFIFYTIFLLAWWFWSGYVPNTWEQFYPARIAEKAQVLVSRDGALCQSKWREYTCPEHDGALIRTIGWSITNHFQIKIFPSNQFFFSFLFLFVFLAIFRRTVSTRLSEAFATKIRVPTPWNSTPRDRVAFFTVAELAALVLTFVFVYLFSHYWYFDHNYNGYWPDKEDGYNIDIAERLSRTLGQTGVFLFALLMFPAARNSPLLAMIGVSWEASIQYHRWLGAAFFVAVMGHMFAAYWWYWKDASLKDIYQIPQKLPTSTDNFTVPIIQWIVWISIISIGFMSLYAPFRRKNFNIFMMLHHFTYLTLIPAILWHAAAAWEYILPSVTIWFFDRIVRAYRSVKRVNLVNASQALQSEPAANPFNPNSIDISVVTPDPISSIHDYSLTFPRIHSLPTVESSLPRAESAINSSPSFSNSTDRHNHHKQRALNVSGPGVKIVDRGEAGQYIELRIVNDHMVYFPGHYAFLNIAEISLFEWHPFTIASPAHYNARPEIVFVIKTMGANTWTQSLYNYVEEFYRDNGYPGTDYVDVPLTVSLDGPYGTPIDFSTYDIVLLLGGGIGITPCKSIYESLLLSYLHDFKARLMYQHTQKTLLEQQNNHNFNGNDSQNTAHNTPLINTTSNLSEPNTNPLLNNLNIVTVPLVETNKRVHLMWSARDPMLFELMSESLSQAPYGPFSAQLYCDHPLRSVQSDADLIKEEISILDKNILSLIRPGRPNLELEFSNIVDGLNPNSYLSGSHDGNSTIAPSASLSEAGRPSGPVDPTSSLHGGFTDESKKKVLVFVCGPEAMAKDAEIICQKKGWDFHTETFAL